MNIGSDDRLAAGARAAAVAAAIVLAFWVCVGWVIAEPVDGETTVGVIAGTVLFVGLPFVVAAAALAWHVARAARGPDVPARLLALATAGRHGRRDEWGAAMRAELASIDDPRERRRFALGCAATALRTGWGRVPWLVAAAAFVGSAVLAFAESRAMLDGDREGILAGGLLPVAVLFTVGLVTARFARSFRAGVESGLVCLVAVLAGLLAVAAPEAVTWYREAGVYILDGDVPPGGIAGPGAAVRDALGGVTFFYLLFDTPWPVVGAALGAWRRRRPEPVSPPAAQPDLPSGSAQVTEPRRAGDPADAPPRPALPIVVPVTPGAR